MIDPPRVGWSDLAVAAGLLCLVGGVILGLLAVGLHVGVSVVRQIVRWFEKQRKGGPF